MKDRIRQIIDREGVTASKFADNLGVQRSSISHLVSGRNKPSLDFIQKVLKNYKQLNPEWFLLGEGKMYKEDSETEKQKNTTQEEHTTSNINKSKETDNVNSDNSKQQEFSMPEKSTDGKTVSKIVVFYSDKTFDAYSPNE